MTIMKKRYLAKNETKIVLPWTFYDDTDKAYNKIFKGYNTLYRKIFNSEEIWIIYRDDENQIYSTNIWWIVNNKHASTSSYFNSLDDIKSEIDFQALKRGYRLVDNIDLVSLL